MIRRPVTQVCFDLLSRPAISVEHQEAQVSSDTGILRIHRFTSFASRSGQ